MFEIERMNETFDYSLVDNETADFLKEREYTINGIAEDARLKIGKELKKAQDKLANHGNGVFVKWYESGGLNKHQVHYYINLERLSTNMDELQKDNFLNAPKSLQKEIMKKNTPDDLKQKVLDGDITTHKEYKQLQQEKLELEQRTKELEQRNESLSKQTELANRKIEELEDAEPQVIERYMEPDDYQETKQSLEQTLHFKKLIEERNKKLEQQIKEMEQQRDEITEKSQKYDDLNKAINHMNARLTDGQQKLKAQKEVHEYVKKANELIREVAPMSYFVHNEFILNNEYAKKPIEKVADDLLEISNKIKKRLNQGDVIDV